MDLLSSLLSSLRIESTSISGWDLTAPWGVNVRNFDPGYCISVLEGQCWARFPGEDPVLLLAGDSLLAPRGKQIAILSSPDADTVEIWDLPWRGEDFHGLDALHQPASAQKVTWGGGGEHSRLLGLAFTFQQGSSDFLLSALPPFITLRGDQAGIFHLIHPAIEFLVDDTNPGYFAVASHLAQLIIVGLLRTHILSADIHPTGWLRGMGDPAIARALNAIHTALQQQWTVASLAETAAMSRSAFASRFARLVGQTPIDYLSQWRIQQAAGLLINTKRSLVDIASQVGYQSDRVFRQAFRQRLGLSPSTYRRMHNDRHAPGY